jgi:hypothetical protein
MDGVIGGQYAVGDPLAAVRGEVGMKLHHHVTGATVSYEFTWIS